MDLSKVKCNSTDVSQEVFHIGRTQEEADTKIVVHMKHCLSMVAEMLKLEQMIPML